VLQKTARHPVILVQRGDVLDELSVLAPVQLRAALAGRADIPCQEALVIGHRDERRLAGARMALNGHGLRVNGRIGLEVIEHLAHAAAPRRKHTPFVELPGLTFVDEPYDANREARAAVRLHAGAVDRGVAPTARGDLFLRRWSGRGRWGECGAAGRRA